MEDGIVMSFPWNRSQGPYWMESSPAAIIFDVRIVLSVNIKAPIMKVWEAFVRPAERSRWWPEVMQIELRKGGLFFHSFYDDEGVEHYSYGHVMEIEEPFHLSFVISDEHGSGWINLTLSLEAQGNLTNLEVSCTSTEVGYSEDLIERYREVWESLLAALKEYVEGGESPGNNIEQ